MNSTLSVVGRRARAEYKAGQLRNLVNQTWGQNDLLEVFGLGIMARLRRDAASTHKSIGKNHFSNHFHAGARNPAGSKLLRRFIRANGARSRNYKVDYARLTGRDYDHLNNPVQSVE